MSDTITIVQVSEQEHIDQLAQFSLQIQLQNFPDANFNKKQQENFLELMKSRIEKIVKTPYYTGFLLKTGSQYASCCSTSLYYDCRRAEKCFYIHGLFTIPEHHNKGFRKRLVNHVIKFGEENGVNGFTCQLHESNVKSQEMFEDLNFEETFDNEFTLIYNAVRENESESNRICKELAEDDKKNFETRLKELNVDIPERPNIRFQEINNLKEFKDLAEKVFDYGNIYNILDDTCEYMLKFDKLGHSFPIKGYFPELFTFYLIFDDEEPVGCFFASANMHVTSCDFRLFVRDFWIREECYQFKNRYLKELLVLLRDTQILEKNRFWHLFICRTNDQDILNILNAFRALDQGYDSWEKFVDEEEQEQQEKHVIFED